MILSVLKEMGYGSLAFLSFRALNSNIFSYHHLKNYVFSFDVGWIRLAVSTSTTTATTATVATATTKKSQPFGEIIVKMSSKRLFRISLT